MNFSLGKCWIYIFFFVSDQSIFQCKLVGICHLNLFLLQSVNITTPKIAQKKTIDQFFDILDWMSSTIPSNWSTFIPILAMFFCIVSFCKFRVLIIWSATGSRLLASTPILFLKQIVYNYINWIENFLKTQMEAGSIIEFQSELQYELNFNRNQKSR